MKETGETSASPNPLQVQIRYASRQDRDFVEELAGKVFSQYGSYNRYLTDWFDTGEITTLIGEVDDEPVGLLMLVAYPNPTKRTEAVADLLAIAVEPRFQSRGLGTILLERAISEARRLPCPVPVRVMHLSVADTNARAQRLFARRGFRLTRGEGVYPAGQRALHMILKVAENLA